MELHISCIFNMNYIYYISCTFYISYIRYMSYIYYISCIYYISRICATLLAIQRLTYYGWTTCICVLCTRACSMSGVLPQRRVSCPFFMLVLPLFPPTHQINAKHSELSHQPTMQKTNFRRGMEG